MKMKLHCGCCGKLCVKKFTPNDGTDRHIEINGAKIQIDNHPFLAADGVKLEFFEPPETPVAMSGSADFTPGGSEGIGYFGINSAFHRMTYWLQQIDASENLSLQLSEPFGTPISLPSGASGPIVPVEFSPATLELPACYLRDCSDYADRVEFSESQDYGLGVDTGGQPETDIEYDQMIFYPPPYIKATHYEVITVKALTANDPNSYSGGTVPFENWPRIEADLDPGDTLDDVDLLIAYNSDLGQTPVAITDIQQEHFYTEETGPYAFDWTNRYPITSGEPLDSWPKHDIELNDNYPSRGGSEQTGVRRSWPVGAAVSELLWCGSCCRFLNGLITAEAFIRSNLLIEREVWISNNETFFSWQSGLTRRWTSPVFKSSSITNNTYNPITGAPNTGFPRPIGVGSYTNGIVFFDADWNAGTLGQFEVTDDEETLPVYFTTRPGAYSGSGAYGSAWPIRPELQDQGGVVPPFINPFYYSVAVGIRDLHLSNSYGRYLKPLFRGTATLTHTWVTDDALDGPTKETLFDVDMNDDDDAFQSDYGSDGRWKLPADFTDDLERIDETYGLTNSGYQFIVVDGEKIIRNGSETTEQHDQWETEFGLHHPKLEWVPSGDDAEFTRKET